VTAADRIRAQMGAHSATAEARELGRATWPGKGENPARLPEGSRKADRQILTALKQEGRALLPVQIAVRTGYAVSGGGFGNAIRNLRRHGLVEELAGGALRITSEGSAAIGDVPPLPTGRALVDHWMRWFGRKAEREVFRVLVEHYPESLPKDRVAELAGYQPNTGGVNNAFSTLRTLELIEGRDEVRASPSLGL
jgi:hypothetical protein